MEIDILNSEIDRLNKKMEENRQEREMLKSDNNCSIDFSILESQLLELEQALYLETSRRNELLKLQQYQDSCSHVFVDDLIDITPDKSKSVKYCVHCMFTLCEEE